MICSPKKVNVRGEIGKNVHIENGKLTVRNYNVSINVFFFLVPHYSMSRARSRARTHARTHTFTCTHAHK